MTTTTLHSPSSITPSSPVVPRPSSADRRVMGPAWHRRVHGVDVLKLKGSFFEMGRQHGALLGPRVKSGPVPYYADFAHRLMGRQVGPLAPLVVGGVQKLIGRRVEQGMPAYARETILGIAAGAGIDPRAFMDGCTMPDALMWLVARMTEARMVGPATRHRVALALGCTSALAWGEATADGKLYHARNLDYHGVGNWPSHTAVIFHEPDEGQRYVSAAAAGVGLGGVTAMNEAGLTLTVHQHMFTTETTLGGTPIGTVGDRVMREARTLDEAQRILAAQKPIGCWTYLVADGNTRQVLCWEENPYRQAPRRTGTQDNTFGYANIYLDAELGATEKNLYGSYWRHNQGRHQRVNALLGERAGTLDAEGMAGIIGHRGSPDCRVRDSMAMVMTVGSVVFRPEDGLVWVGTGEAPTSRGTWVPFSLRTEDHDPTERTFNLADGETDAQREAFQCYRRAYVAYMDDSDATAACAHAERALELDGSQSLYAFLAGVLALNAGQPERALRNLQRAVELGHADEERRSAFHLWRGRARDLLGQRPAAVQDYRSALGHHADGPVHAAARAGLRRPFAASRAARVQVEMSLADVIQP